MLYLDNHSITKPCQAALDRMMPYLEKQWGAPFSPHKMGSEVLSDLYAKEQMILDLVEAKSPDQLIFTSSKKEAANQIFSSVFLEVARKEGKTHFILSEREDLVVLEAAKQLEEMGCTLKIIPMKDGVVDRDLLFQAIGPKTALVSLSMADGFSGVIQPLDDLFEHCKAKGALLHLDASYAMGKYAFNFQADYMSFSGQLVHSVQGSSGFFIRQGAPLKIQESSLDVASFMALSAAAQQSLLYLDTMVLEGARLRDFFESQVEGKVLFQNSLRLPNTSLIHFENVHRETLCYFLARKGVFANMGGFVDPAYQDPYALSFALSRMSTEEELLQAAKIINETLLELRRLAEVF